MRTAVTVSVAVHAALIVAGIVAIPAARLDLSAEIDVIPVQLIDIAEVTELAIGLDNVVPLVPEPEPVAPEPEPEPLPPEPAPEPEPPAPEPVVEPDPVVEPEPEPPAPEPVEVAAAEPEVRVIEPGPVPAPEAEPAPEPEPATEPEPEPAPEPQPAAIVPTPIPRPRPTAEPEPEPAPAEPDPEPKPEAPAVEVAEAAEPDAIAALLNAAEPAVAEPAGTETGVDNAAMTQSEIDAFYSALARCWRLPAVWDNNPAEFTVVIRFELNIDGTVRGIPLVLQAPTGPYAQVARETALRAIFDCQPYQLPLQKYDAWRENTVTFNPVDMFLP